jgi:CopG family nickel-responsive transcriptional regulator
MLIAVLPLDDSPSSPKVIVPAMSRPQPTLARFSVSLPSDLLDELDDMVVRRKLPNRSHAIAEMAREQLTEHAREVGTKSMAGTISLVYDYRKRNLQRKLADIQHENYLMVVTSTNVHLENHHYLEVLLVQGPARDLRRLADTLAACKGVKHAKLSLTATAMPPLL